MKWFGGENKEPSLTRDARKLSEKLLSLDEVGRARAIETIGAITLGIRSLGTMPPEVVDHLWSILCTVARKAVMGGDADKMMTEIENGLAPEVRQMIVGKAS